MADETSIVPMLESCRTALRFGSSTAYDGEIEDLIAAARVQMRLGGVSEDKAGDDTDPAVRVAIKTYVKANFGLDNPDSAALNVSFADQVTQLKCSEEYGASDE